MILACQQQYSLHYIEAAPATTSAFIFQTEFDVSPVFYGWLTQVWPFHPENQKFHHYF